MDVLKFESFLVSFFFVVICIPFLIFMAHRFKWLSKQDFRRKEKNQVPLMGGASIYLSVVFVSLITGNASSSWAFLIGAASLVIMGVFDDVLELSSKVKFMAQFLSLFFWFTLLPADQLLLVQFGMGDWPARFLVAFWILGVMNAVNMIDGMDGVAGSFSFLTLGFLSLIHSGSNSYLSLSIMGAVLGFLIYNRPPAKIYLGESGSSFLGFILAALASTIPLNGGNFSVILIPLFLLAYPEIDAVLAIFRRLKAHSSPFRGDHDHIHHKLKKLGFTIPQTLMIFSFVTFYCGLTSYLIYQKPSGEILASTLFLSISGMMILLGSVYYLEYRLAHKTSNYSQTLLNKYIQLEEDVAIQPLKFQATIFDLLPYYKEIQNRGVDEVHDFIRDFAAYLQDNFKEAQIKPSGSYSVIVIEHPKKMNKFLTHEVVQSFYKLLNKHGVQKNNNDEIPWGLRFYSSLNKGPVFLKKFGLLDNLVSDVKLKKIA